MNILWVGDAALAQRFASRRAPQVHIRGCDAAGVAQQFLDHRDPSSRPLDLIVIDATERGVDALQVAALANSHAIDLPIIVLVAVGQESIAERLSRVAVCDCIVKTQDFIHQFLPAAMQVRARHDLTTAFEVTRQREERVRTILETQPAVACIVEPSGRIVAVNRAGQALFGGSSDQLIGHDIAEFIPAESLADVLPIFREQVGEAKGGCAHALIRVDGTRRQVYTRSIPMARLDGVVSLVTMDDRGEISPAVSAGDAEAAANATQLRDENERLTRDLAEARAASEAGDRERARLAQAMVEHDQFHARIRAELEAERDRLLTALRQWELSQKDQRESVAALQREHAAAIHALELRLGEQAAGITELEAERDRLASALQVAQTRGDDLLTERIRWEELAHEHTRHVESLSTLQESHERVTAALEAAVVKQQWLTVERLQLDEELANERARHTERSAAAASLQAECEQLRAECDRLAGERDRLMSARDQLATERDQLSGRLEELKSHAEDGGTRQERAQLTLALQESRRQQSAIEAERAAERAQWTLTATRTADDQRAALRALEAECERLTDELCKAEARLTERHAAEAAQRDIERTTHQSMALELVGAQERIQHLVQEITGLQTALSQADARNRSLRRSSAAAEARAGELAERFERLLEGDRTDLLQLRRNLSQLLIDAERQCKALVDRRNSVRPPWDEWMNVAEHPDLESLGDVRNTEPRSDGPSTEAPAVPGTD